MPENPSFIVLGASGWIGHYLVPALRALHPQAGITAVFRSRVPTFSAPHIRSVQPSGNGLLSLLELLPPGAVIHLGRGEEEKDFTLHQNIIQLQNQRRMRYLFASSFNALDADVSKPHLEADLPGAQSGYGKFKARCEMELMEKCSRPLVFRFGATHGWAPNREARTQDFLKKLKAGESVSVGSGILQNRSFVGDLAQQIALLASKDELEGVFHLGTADFSDELGFLKNLAAAFGHDPGKILEGEATPCNAVMVVDGLRKAFPAYSLPTERETIAKVRAQAELRNYFK